MIVSQTEHSHNMTVDISLCGNLTRKEVNDRLCSSVCSLKSLSVHSKGIDSSSLSTSAVFCKGSVREAQWSAVLQSMNIHESAVSERMQERTSEKLAFPQAPIIEPPSWAEAAKGEARLEPVCDSVGKQYSVDLSSKSCYRVGRAPNSDIQLFHATSSRRHAIIFHHSNGACYIVDCGSAHGTYINGRRVATSSANGVMVPQKVRRGSIIQFGGVGAPCFVLKSFSFRLEDITDCPADSEDMGVLVRRNTRLNALGISLSERIIDDTEGIIMSLNVQRKRSFDSLSSNETLDDDYESENKRIRCCSPPLSPEVPIRLVSPDLSSVRASKPRRVTFSSEPPQTFHDDAFVLNAYSGKNVHAGEFAGQPLPPCI